MPASIFKGSKVKTLKDTLTINDKNDFIVGDTDDPTSTAKEAAAGSLYFRGGTNEIYKKQDSGSSTNWAVLRTGANADLSITTKTANYTATTADDVILCDATGGGFTITLYTAIANAGKTIRIIKTDSSTNSITVDGNGSETIAGYLTYSFSVKNNFMEIVSDGANWQIISEKVNVSLYANTAAGQSIPNGTETTVVFGSVVHQTHASSYNTSTGVYTIPYTDWYKISAMVTYSISTVGSRLHYLRFNSNYIALLGILTGSTIRQGLCGEVSYYLSAGDTIYINAYQNSGGALALFNNAQENYFTISRDI